MGEIANGLINGDFDAFTGEYLGRGFGIPRTRDRSLPWEEYSDEEKIYGVKNFLSKKGIKKEQQLIFVQEFAESEKFVGDEKNKLFLFAQSKFNLFAKFVNAKNKK